MSYYQDGVKEGNHQLNLTLTGKYKIKEKCRKYRQRVMQETTFLNFRTNEADLARG
jgi:hypothetical protein